MRPKDAARVAISSLPLDWNSGASSLPRLTWSASSESWVTGRITIVYSITLRATKMNTNTPVSDSMNTLKVSFAFWIGTVIGTETICAPIISLSFQPKPLAPP